MCTRQYLETCICIPADTQALERIKVCEIIMIIIISKLMIIHELQVDNCNTTSCRLTTIGFTRSELLLKDTPCF